MENLIAPKNSGTEHEALLQHSLDRSQPQQESKAQQGGFRRESQDSPANVIRRSNRLVAKLKQLLSDIANNG